MHNQNLRPGNPINSDGGFKEKAKEQFSKLKNIAEEGYRNSVECIQKNPATTLKVGATALAFSFMFGYISGINSKTAERMGSLNHTMRIINQQNFNILHSLQEMTTTYNSLNARVENLEKQSKVRLDNIENKIQFKEATQKGEEHVKKMEKKRGWKKILPWNW